MTSLICPSMMCADMFDLKKSISLLEECGADFLHIDIMDGVFVPNYTLGTDYIKNLHKFTDIPQDIHLMITSPETKLDRFDIKKGDCVSFHYEATSDAAYCINYIANKGAYPILAINPDTDISVLKPYLPTLYGVLVMTVFPGYAGQKLVQGSIEKIKSTRDMCNEAGYSNIRIEVDGNVSFENATLMRQAGADMFVAGTSSVFCSNMQLLQAYLKLEEYVK